MDSTATGPAAKAKPADTGRSAAARSAAARSGSARSGAGRAARAARPARAGPTQPGGQADQQHGQPGSAPRTAVRAGAAVRASTAKPADAPPPSASYREVADSRVDSHNGTRTESVAGQVQSLVTALAPLLGLDPARVRVGIATSDADPHGSAASEAITLTGALDLSASRAGALLLHELAHARQHLNRTETPGIRPDQSAAEAEAAGLAHALRQGRALWVPRQALPEGHVAHDDGATGIAPATAPAPAPAAATATTPDVTSLEQTLDGLVLTNHSADVQTITGLLDHPWTQVTEEMIENSLRLLSVLQFVVARALVRALDPAVRRHLAQLRDSHHQKYPEQAVAVLSALSADDLKNLSSSKLTPAGPVQPGALTAFHGVNPSRLSATAMRALLSTLRRLSVATVIELEKSNREVFRPLLQTGPDTGTDEAELRRAIEGEQALSASRTGGGGILAGRLIGLLQQRTEEGARQALTALAPLCAAAAKDSPSTPADAPAIAPVKTPPTLDDLRAAVAKPVAKGAGSNAPPATTPALIAILAKIDKDGLIDRLIDDLPEGDRRGELFGPVLKTVLAARAPLPNLSRATELLSYGLVDWKIWDAEARLAYLLVRSTPIAAQDSWRQLDNGKWASRLLDNLPDDMWSSGEYTGVGSEYTTGGGDDLGVPAKLLQEYADTLIARYQRLPIPPIARNLVRELLGLDHDGKPKPWLTENGVATKQDPALRIAIIRRIDARRQLNAIITGLPDDYLFGEQGRIELLDLNQLRDPFQLRQQALGLAPSGLGWLSFTHRDAWIAVQAIRALSPADQQRFTIENPSVWTVLWAGLTADMRRALPTTLATGRDERLPTRESIRDRLGDERLWTEALADELRALINLAYAADDKAWVFEKSKQLRADLRAKGSPLLTAVVTDLKLYSEADKRTAYLPERTASSRAPVWGYALGVVGRALGILLYDWLIEDSISLSGKTMHLTGFDLGDLQTILGGDLQGVTLGESKNGANKIDVDTTFEAGFIVNLDLKDLQLQGVNIVGPGTSFRSGPVSVKGLKASAGFSDRGYHDPAYILVSLDSLALRDLVLIDPTLPFSGAWAIARLALQRLDFRATQDGSDDLKGKLGQQLPKGTMPIPIFGPLFQLLKNIVALKGSIPGDFTLLDYALLPANLPFPISTMVSASANALLPTPTPATYLWGLASDGVLRPPYSAAQRMKDAAGMLRAFNVSFQSLAVEGISIGSGQQIKSLTLTDVNLSVGQSLPAYLNGALATLRLAKGKLPPDSPQHKDLDVRIAALETQIAAVQASPHIKELRAKRAKDPDSLTEAERAELALADKSTADEERLRALEGKDRWNPGSLSEDERRQLVELIRRLRSDVGVSAEIGSITLGQLSGDIQAAGVTLKGIHARAKLPNVGILPYAPGYLDDKSLVEQFMAGGPKIPSVGELAKGSEFSLTVDSTEMLSTDPSQPAIILKADTLPKAADVQAQLAALPEIEGNKPIRTRLAQALDVLVALERARGVAALGATEQARAAAAQRVRELTDDARRLLGIEIGGLKFGRITGELDPKTGAISVVVHDTEATGLAGPGFAVDSLKGSLRLSLGAGDVTARPDQLKGVDPATLVTQLKPGLGLSGVVATGIHLPQGSIGKATIGTLSGSLQATEKGYRIPDLYLDHLEIDDISMGKDGDGIKGVKATVDNFRMDVEVELDQGATGSTVKSATIHSLRIGAIGGEHLVLDMPQPDGAIHAELISGALHDISATDVVFEQGSQGWELVKASGSIGSFADVRYSVLMGALKSRTSVKGSLATTKDAVANKRPTITASYAKAGGRVFSLKVADLQALGTDISTPDGKVRIRKVTIAAGVEGSLEGKDAGAKANATLTNLVIGPIDWKAGTGRVTGPGPIVARTVTVAAFYTPAVPAAGKQNAKPAAWTITDIVITSLEGNGLRYLDPPIDMRLGRTDKPATAGKAPLTVGRIHIQPARNKVQVKDLGVDFGGDLKSTLGVNGHLGIEYLSMELHRGGRVVATVRGVSAEVAVTGDYTGTLEIKGLRGATVDVGPDAIRIGSDDPTDPNGFQIHQLSVSSLKLESQAGGHKFKFSTQSDGRVDLLGIRAKVRIDKWLPTEKHTSKSAFKQVVVENLVIDQVNLSAFQIDLPDDDVTIIVPARKDTDPPTLRRLQLTGGVGADGVFHPEFLFNLETFALEGKLGVEDIALPINARIKDKFKGDVRLTTWASSIGFLAGGGIRIDVERPQLTMAKAAELGKDKTIRIAKLGADSLSFAEGRLYVKRPYAEDLEFTQKIGDSLAVWLKVKSASLDELNYTTTPGGGLVIPRLDIADAFLSLDVAALTAKKSDAAASTPSAFDKTALRPIVDQTDGTVKVVMYVSADVLGLKDIRIGTPDDPLTVPIRRGAVDIPTFERNVKGKVHATQIGSGFYLRPWVVNAVAEDPILRLNGSQLQLGVYIVNPGDVEKGNDPQGKNRPHSRLWKDILTWDLHGPDFTRAGMDKFTLWAAIFDLHKELEPTAAQKASQTEAEKAEQLEKDAESQAVLDSLELRSLVADLSIKNSGPLPLKISSDDAFGTVTLSDQALLNLHVAGGVPAVKKPPARSGSNPGGFEFGLDALKVDSVDLTLLDRQTPGGKITGHQQLYTGQIKITDLVDGHISFDDLFHPQRFTATIKHASADNVRWYTN
ncbi:MAG TPA: hypothetical protein VF557_18270 [Jatrophihabitans sp.]|uniref:hypothetical protein n=1 Tax=Jatrophihabitans sp. TaxID=1932789 RepID=UPI002EE7E4F3